MPRLYSQASDTRDRPRNSRALLVVVACLILMPPGPCQPLAAQSALNQLTVEGLFRLRAQTPDHKLRRNFNGSFQYQRSGGKYQIRYKINNSISSVTEVFDGAQLYNLTAFPSYSPEAAGTATNLPVAVLERKKRKYLDMNLAIIGDNISVANDCFVKVIWLAYSDWIAVSNSILQRFSNPHCAVLSSANGNSHYTLWIEPESRTSGFCEGLEFISNKGLSANQFRTGNAPPLRNASLLATYAIKETTNLDSHVIPSKSTFTVYSPRVGKGVDNWSERFTLSTTNAYERIQHRIAAPPLVRWTDVSDARFFSTNLNRVISFIYTVTNGLWPKKTDPDLMARFRNLEQGLVTSIHNKTVRVRRLRRRMAVILLLAVAPLVFLWWTRKRRKRELMAED